MLKITILLFPFLLFVPKAFSDLPEGVLKIEEPYGPVDNFHALPNKFEGEIQDELKPHIYTKIKSMFDASQTSFPKIEKWISWETNEMPFSGCAIASKKGEIRRVDDLIFFTFQVLIPGNGPIDPSSLNVQTILQRYSLINKLIEAGAKFNDDGVLDLNQIKNWNRTGTLCYYNRTAKQDWQFIETENSETEFKQIISCADGGLKQIVIARKINEFLVFKINNQSIEYGYCW